MQTKGLVLQKTQERTQDQMRHNQHITNNLFEVASEKRTQGIGSQIPNPVGNPSHSLPSQPNAHNSLFFSDLRADLALERTRNEPEPHRILRNGEGITLP